MSEARKQMEKEEGERGKEAWGEGGEGRSVCVTCHTVVH